MQGVSHQMKKILFITPSLRAGGAEKVISILANGFYKRGYGSTIMITKWNEIQCKVDPGVSIIVNKNISTSFVSQILAIRKELEQGEYECVISFLTMQNLYTLLANIFIGQKIIVSERNDPKITAKGDPFIGFLRKVLYKKAYKIVFQTNDAAAYFEPTIREKGVVIGNPIDDEKMPERYRGERDKRIVTVARLERQKNIPLLLEAFRNVHEKHRDHRLEIYGTGALEDDLKNYARELHIAEMVDFCGKKDNIPERIASASMFVLSSDHEGISNAMLEAMAVGLPVICTDCPVGGARTYISDHINGLLTEVGDVDGLTKAMNYVIEDPVDAERMGAEAIKIRNVSSVSTIIDKWESCIQ